mgnify:CR=1 FL=1
MYYNAKAHMKPQNKPNGTIFKKYKTCPPHKSCKPKRDAYFVKVSPYRYNDEYGWWSGKFEEDVNAFEADFKNFIEKSIALNPYDMRIVSKSQYDYVSLTFVEEEDALELEKAMQHKDRNGYKFVVDIIKGEVVAQDEIEEGEVKDCDFFDKPSEETTNYAQSGVNDEAEGKEHSLIDETKNANNEQCQFAVCEEGAESPHSCFRQTDDDANDDGEEDDEDYF